MKQLTLFVILISSQFVLAQTKFNDAPANSEINHMQYQIGFAATNFLKELVVPNNVTSTNKSPYDFNAKAFYTKDGKIFYGLRFGLGYSNTRNAQFNILSNSESTSEDVTTNFRLGFELQQHLSDRWTIYYGLDYIYGNSNTTTIATFNNGSSIEKDISKDRKHTTGLGPVMGLQFRINKHICLGTELTLYFTQFDGGSITTTSNPSSNPIISDINNNGRNSNIIVPTFINLNIIL